jgi:primosomal replication protein N
MNTSRHFRHFSSLSSHHRFCLSKLSRHTRRAHHCSRSRSCVTLVSHFRCSCHARHSLRFRQSSLSSPSSLRHLLFGHSPRSRLSVPFITRYHRHFRHVTLVFLITGAVDEFPSLSGSLHHSHYPTPSSLVPRITRPFHSYHSRRLVAFVFCLLVTVATFVILVGFVARHFRRSSLSSLVTFVILVGFVARHFRRSSLSSFLTFVARHFRRSSLSSLVTFVARHFRRSSLSSLVTVAARHFRRLSLSPLVTFAARHFRHSCRVTLTTLGTSSHRRHFITFTTSRHSQLLCLSSLQALSVLWSRSVSLNNISRGNSKRCLSLQFTIELYSISRKSWKMPRTTKSCKLFLDLAVTCRQPFFGSSISHCSHKSTANAPDLEVNHLELIV